MCGIAGFITDGQPAEFPLIKRMCDRLEHRGPDAFGHFLEGPLALGHRRLSIIDVGGGSQPIGNEDDSLQVVFNGEIYNYRELRADLEAKGHRFRTSSDTEVLVHLYEEVGTRLPEHLNGMFAFALWDRRRRELFLARDRYGKKPLYYSLAGQPGMALAFASELKALAALPGFRAGVNPESVAQFLSFGYVTHPRTIFGSVEQLPPAHSLLWSAPQGARLTRYWQPTFTPDLSLGYFHARRDLAALAEESVRCRMISDVPLGGFLSGGVDSSAVVAMMARQQAQVRTFSIGFTNEDFDEVRYARAVAGRYRTEHHEEIVSPAVLQTLQVLVRHFDEPFADPSALPTLSLARMTRQHVTVALSGDGADELLGGYRRYKMALNEERVRNVLPGWFRGSVVRPLASLYPALEWAPRYLRAKATLSGIAQDLGQGYFHSMSAFSFGGLFETALSGDLKSQLNGYSPRAEYLERFARLAHLPPLQRLQAIDVETYLPACILVKVDRATMAYSLESRSPWLDYRLGDLAGRLPAEYKLHQGSGKHIFKDAMAPHLPAEILARRKMGFGVPMREWLRTSLKGLFESMVLRPGMAKYIDPATTRRLWAEHQSGRRDWRRELWHILMLACWDDQHANPSHPGDLLESSVAQSCARS